MLAPFLGPPQIVVAKLKGNYSYAQADPQVELIIAIGLEFE